MFMDLFRYAEDFKDPDATAEAEFAATLTTVGGFGEVAKARFGWINLHGGEAAFKVVGFVIGGLRAMGTEAADEALRDDHFDGGCDQEGLDVHVDETGEGAGGIIRMEGAENKVPGQGGTDRDIGGFAVTDFPDHDNVGILAEDGAECFGKGEADFGVHLGLVDAGDFVFNGILDGDNTALGFVDEPNVGGQGSGFTGTSGAGDKDDAVGGGKGTGQFLFLVLSKAKLNHGKGFGLLTQEAKAHAFTVHGREGGNTDIEFTVAGTKGDAPVLGAALFRDVELCHDLEAGDDGALEFDEVIGHAHCNQFAVDPVADLELVAEGLKMNIGGAVVDRFLYDFIDEANHGGVLVFFGFKVGVFGKDVGFVKGVGAHSKVLGNSIVDHFGIAEEPFGLPAAGRVNPAIHIGVRGPKGDETEGCLWVFLRFVGIIFSCDGKALIGVDEAQWNGGGWVVEQFDFAEEGEVAGLGKFFQ